MSAKLRPHANALTLTSLAVIVACLLVGAEALGRGAAPASHVGCGDTITTKTTLDSDLVDCPSNGIVIGADDVTLDLNGHTIAGDGELVRRCPRREPCDVGVVNDGHDGVTVRNGSLSAFATGVGVVHARRNRVLGIAASRNQFFGFVVIDSARTLIRDSSGNDNPEPDGDGMGVFGSNHIRIVNNSFRRNAQLGMHVERSTDILIQGNVLSRNTDMGILFTEANRNQVRGNRCARNGTCIIVGPGSQNVIAANRSFRDRAGLAVEKGRDNLVARNVVVRARTSGIYLGLGEPPIGGANNVVRRNLVRASGGDGFQVHGKDRNSRLGRNLAIGSGDDGFDVESTSARLTSNRARHNGDLGIEAVPGVIDGGGNAAGGNGNSLQCTNVFCR